MSNDIQSTVPAETTSKKPDPLFPHSHKSLRLMTYLTPGIAVEIFELVRDYLESELGLNAIVIYESRWSGPPPDRVDPLSSDEADIVFMCSTAYAKEKEKGNKNMELCKAAPLHVHPSAGNEPVYFAEIVVHKDNAERFKDFERMRGSCWAFNDVISLSGHMMMLSELKKQGHNISFFGNVVQSGSHRGSLQMILNGRADVATIDSNTLALYKQEYPERAEDFHVVSSLGPMPIQPIVFNSRMSPELKGAITQALLNVAKNPRWSQRFLQRGINGYAEVNEDFYSMAETVIDSVKKMMSKPSYY